MSGFKEGADRYPRLTPGSKLAGSMHCVKFCVMFSGPDTGELRGVSVMGSWMPPQAPLAEGSGLHLHRDMAGTGTSYFRVAIAATYCLSHPAAMATEMDKLANPVGGRLTAWQIRSTKERPGVRIDIIMFCQRRHLSALHSAACLDCIVTHAIIAIINSPPSTHTTLQRHYQPPR
jgi:hypothetical protein